MDTDLMKDLLASQEQKEYIETLLDMADASLYDYTDTPLDELFKKDASEVIDAIKEDLGLD